MSLTIRPQNNSNAITIPNTPETVPTTTAEKIKNVFIGVILLQISLCDSAISLTKKIVTTIAESIKECFFEAISLQVRIAASILSLILPLENRPATDMTESSNPDPRTPPMPRLHEQDGFTTHTLAINSSIIPTPHEQDHFADYVQGRNTDRLDQARTQSDRGADFIYDLIKGKPELKEEIESYDPDIFVKVPQLAVEAVVTRAEEPTTENTPEFMHGYLRDLTRLHSENRRDGAIPGESKAIASKMHQGNVAFNAAMESAFQKASA